MATDCFLKDCKQDDFDVIFPINRLYLLSNFQRKMCSNVNLKVIYNV